MIISMRGAYSDIVSTQRVFDVVKSIANLRSQRFTGYTVDDVLVLTIREFFTATQRLPQPDCRNVSYRIALHVMFGLPSRDFGARQVPKLQFQPPRTIPKSIAVHPEFVEHAEQ
jgi:hypothetical protein